MNAVSTCSGRASLELVLEKKSGDNHNEEKVVETSEPSTRTVEAELRAKPPPLFPQKLKKKEEKECFDKFIRLLKQVHINLLLIDVLQGIPKYTKYVKDIMANKRRLTEYETVALT